MGKHLPIVITVILLLIIGSNGSAQQLKQERIQSKTPIICYAGEERLTNIPPPESFQKLRENAVGRTKTATFEVNYIGFTPAAQAAFQFAVDIWETQISSAVPIRVTAVWQPLGENVLGSAIPGTLYTNFPGAQQLNTWYPVALAEKIAGRDINDTDEIDIVANFSSSANWYLQTSGTPAVGQNDLVTVVLHELGHGLGIVDTYNVPEDGTAINGSVGLETRPIIYDRFIENSAGQNLYLDFASPSPALKSQLISNSLFFDSPSVLSGNGNQRGKIYAPSSFDVGSSIAHLDELSYNGTNNALMTPQIGAREIIHNPGPITLGILADMGWVYTRINHTPLKGSENVNGPYVVTATITSDAGAISNPKLFYSNGGADIEVAMTLTANPNEYTASIPGTGSPASYAYYIKVQDAFGREFTNPGILVDPGDTQQFYFLFSTGPDTKAPRITHSPKAFILDTDTDLEVEAIISDNTAIASATLEYLINDISQTNIPMQPGTPDSLYSATINLGGGLTIGDVIKYRIVAVDASSNQNQKISPASDYYTVNVVGLSATQDSYENNFDVPSDDFFGDGFSITTPAGFTSPGINTTHPYLEGDGFPNNQLDLVYQLKIPIRVKEDDATIKFDEIVLVEPGSDTTVFGDAEFFDYVVAEGSVDGGVTWVPIEDGYDSRANAIWLKRYNSAITGNNSTAVGDPSLFRERVIDLRNKFNEGDEVVIRFHLFSDPFAAGWGWSIDNLRIQIDDKPPLVLNDHIDYLVAGTENLRIDTRVIDASGVRDLFIEYQINDDPQETFDFIVIPSQDEYSLTLNIPGIGEGDNIRYRIVAEDNAGIVGAFPPDGFIEVPVIQFGTPVSSYASNFNSVSTDFVGNFFSITQPSGFPNGLIQSTSPYLTGRGLDQTSNFNFTLKKPINIDRDNPYIRYDEIAIVENHPGSAAFGTPAFKDYVVVEGSKDGGSTWLPFLTGYDALASSPWNSAYLTNANGTPAMFKRRTINMLESGNFSSDDDVIIRFRLFSDGNKNGYGWVLDNLYIQDIITGIEHTSFIQSISLYPNPVKHDKVVLRVESQEINQFGVSITSALGLPLQQEVITMEDPIHELVIDTSSLPNGIYLVKVAHKNGSVVKKFNVAH